MEQQAQAPQTSTGSLDPQAVNLAKAIRQTETGGNANAVGKSGEYGAYQFTQPTWDNLSKQAGVNVPLKQANLEQQNQVAYYAIKKWKDAGYNPGQIASMWNAGGGEPDAYTGKFSNGQPSVGVNKYGVHYDVPAYAKSVMAAYNTFKGGGNVSQPDAQNPSSTANQTPTEQPQPLANRIANVLGFGGTVNTLADYIAKAQHPELSQYIETPTAGQTAGAALQLGSLAFPYGRVAGLGAKALGGILPEAAARIGGSALAGAAGGYTQDVAQGLLDKKSAADTLTPGTGTVIGGALGGTTGALGEYLSPANRQQKAVSSIQKNIEDVLNGTKSGRQWLAAEKAAGNDPVGDMVKAGFVPDVQDGKLTIQGLHEGDRAAIVTKLSNLRSAALDATGQSASTESLFQAAANPQDAAILERMKATGDMPKMKAEVARIVSQLRNEYGDSLSMGNLETIKEVNAQLSRKMATADPALSDARKQISLAAQKLIEQRAEASGLPGVAELNQEIKKYHVTMPATFEKLEGATIRGGRLGNILKQHTAGVIGGVAGTTLGGGAASTIVGALTAEKAMAILNKIIGDNSISTPMKERIIAEIARQEPEVVQQFLQYIGKEEGTIAPQLAPRLAPTKLGGGLLGRAVTNIGSRMAAQ